MKTFFTVSTVLASPSAFALFVTPSPQAVPAVGVWGLAAIGAALALAGAIAVFRTRK